MKTTNRKRFNRFVKKLALLNDMAYHEVEQIYYRQKCCVKSTQMIINLQKLLTMLYILSRIFGMDLSKAHKSTFVYDDYTKVVKTEFSTSVKNGQEYPVRNVVEKKYVLGQLVDEQHFTIFNLESQLN